MMKENNTTQYGPDGHDFEVLLHLRGAIRVGGKDSAGEVLVGHRTELLGDPGLHLVQALLRVQHHLHLVGRVVLLVELHHHVSGVEALAGRHLAEGVEVAGGEGVQRVVRAGQRLEQLKFSPGVVLLCVIVIANLNLL